MAQRREFWGQQEKVIREVLNIEMGNGTNASTVMAASGRVR